MCAASYKSWGSDIPNLGLEPKWAQIVIIVIVVAVAAAAAIVVVGVVVAFLVKLAHTCRWINNTSCYLHQPATANTTEEALNTSPQLSLQPANSRPDLSTILRA